MSVKRIFFKDKYVYLNSAKPFCLKKKRKKKRKNQKNLFASLPVIFAELITCLLILSGFRSKFWFLLRNVFSSLGLGLFFGSAGFVFTSFPLILFRISAFPDLPLVRCLRRVHAIKSDDSHSFFFFFF